MQAFAALRSFGRAWLRRRRMEREMDDEMQFHLAARAADLEAEGLPPAEAAVRARREFGAVELWKDAGRDARGLRLVDDLIADLRYALRAMRRAPAFTAAAVVSLTLGIGANTAVFGLMDLLLLKPVAVSHPDELVHVTMVGERATGSSGFSNYPWFRQVAARTDLFSDAMLSRQGVAKVGIAGHIEPLVTQRVTPNYYQLLGVPALLGRTFVSADRVEGGGAPVAVISYDLWQRRFEGSRDAVGASITVNQRSYTIVGVTPRAFRGLLVGWTIDVTIPLDTAEFADPNNWFSMPLIARLRPGVDAARVAAQLTPVLRHASGGVNESFRRRFMERIAVESAAAGITDLRSEFGRPTRLLMIAVVLLLLVACVNLAGLLVARNAARQQELKMRLALGAGRWRIARQLLTECVLLALLGAIPGLMLAIAAGNALLRFLPPYFGPLSIAVTVDWRILSFTVAVTAATALLFGLLPALQASRSATWPTVVRASQSAVGVRIRAGRILIVAQCALSLVLVAGAALFVRTLLNLWQVDTGFDRDHVVVVHMDPAGTPYERDRLRAFQRDALAALAALPYARQVTLATSSPFNGNMDGRRLAVPGVEPRDADDATVQVNLVAAGYFDALRVPILRGRPIEERDIAGAPPVAVVSDSFARRYFGDAAKAIGRQITIGRGPTAITHEIVGVARDVRDRNLRTAPDRLAYLPWFQDRVVRLAPFEFLIATTQDPTRAVAATRRAIERLHPDAPITKIETMPEVIGGRLRSERLLATLGTAFAVIALVLAAVGMHGLLAYVVARRVPEFGVRLALGARPVELLWLTLRDNVMLVATGAGVGIIGAVAGLRVVDGLLFGLSPTDGTTLTIAALVLMAASIAGAAVPARRAAMVDPLVALRAE